MSCSLVAAVLSAVTANARGLADSKAQLGSTEGRIVVLGDSLAVSPSKADGFPTQLQKRLNKGAAQWMVTNAGVRGDTTSDALRRFNTSLPADTRILVLALGANDGLRGVSIATIEKNLVTMIERAQARDIKVLLCGMIVPPRFGWDYTIAFHELFKRLASTYDVPLVPFLLEDVALRSDMNGPDGIHPNASGAERIAATVWRYLEPLLRRTDTSD